MIDKNYKARRQERWYFEDHMEQLKSIIDDYNKSHSNLFNELKLEPQWGNIKEYKKNRVVCVMVNQCVRCGSKRQLKSHHIIPRTHDLVVHDVENLVCLCHCCHRKIHGLIDNIHDSSLIDITFDFLNELDKS